MPPGSGKEHIAVLWFYEIRGSGNRLVKRGGQFGTEQEAIAAGTAYLDSHKHSVIQANHPDELFTVMAGRAAADFIRPDPASHE
jgi:hypothetical protein